MNQTPHKSPFKIVITRPADQAQGMLNRLLGLGFEAINLPLIQIEPLPVTPEWHRIKSNLNQCDTIIFISKNAVSHSLKFLSEHLQEASKQIKVFGIGESTCNSLSHAGITVQEPPKPETTEGLIELIRKTHPSPKACLIVKGAGGREDLENWFKQRAIQCTLLPAYQRTPKMLPSRQIINAFQPAPAAICITSGEILNLLANLKNQTNIDSFQLPIIVPSERVADLARQLGFKVILTSSGAGVEPQTQAVLNLLRPKTSSYE